MGSQILKHYLFNSFKNFTLSTNKEMRELKKYLYIMGYGKFLNNTERSSISDSMFD